MGTSPQLAPPPQLVDVPLALFGGTHTGVAPTDLPEGLSPDNQDMAYVPGEAFTRPCLSKVLNPPAPGNVAMLYSKTYVQPNGDPLTLTMDSAGNIFVEDVANSPGTIAALNQVTAGISALSASAFGREYIALSDLLHGQWCPLQYDGTNLDRVTQDGPGISPTVINIAPPPATLSNSGAGASFTITAVTPSDPQTERIRVETDDGQGGYKTVTTYTTLTVTVTTSITGTIVVGTRVALSGITPSSFNQPSVVCNGVGSSTTFKITNATGSSASGTGGTVTVQNPSLSRINNIVTAVTSAAHGFQAGWQVLIAMANNNIGGGITNVSRDGNGVVTIKTTNPHGLVIGSNVCIVGVTAPDTSFNVTSVLVASVPTSTTFTYSQSGTAESSSSPGGNVQDIWSGTFFIQSVPNATTFTYQNTGPNDLTNTSGTATIIGQISPGNHNFVVMYVTRNGAITRPSPPVAFGANGGQQAFLSGLPIGPPDVVARLIGATGAGGDNYFTIPETPQVGGMVVGTSLLIPDNTSTSATIDFNDNTLFDSIAIDQIGNDLFDQRVLVSPIGFYAYASRLITWGDYNSIQNLLNMTLAAGSDLVTVAAFAGSGANSGSGTAWSNPSNIGSTSSYADVSLISAGTSQKLLSGTFAFAVANSVAQLRASFNYYATGNAAALQVQLLKAGVPFGVAQNINIPGGGAGSALQPLSGNLNFPVGSLTAADVNNSAFGLQFSVIFSPGVVHLFVNAAAVSVSTSTLLPQGWSASGSTGGTGIMQPSTLPGMYERYQMTSAGGTNDCMISQPAFQDAFGTAILLPSTRYSWRFYATSTPATGHLVADLFSPSQGILASASLNLAAPPNLGFVILELSADTPIQIPADALIRIYLQGVTAAAVVTLGENSLIYTQNPYRGNISDVSYVLNPEGIAQTTGLLGSADDPSPVMCFSVQRNVTLLKSYAGTHTFQDNGSEPYQWQINNLSRSVGACSIRGGDPGQFGTGDAAEDWDVTANQNGLYLFSGGDFWKISQELDRGDPDGSVPTWQDINWAAEQTLVVKNDPRTHRIYVLAPINGATQPNVLFVCDYKELDTAADLANGPSLKIGITGKMLSTDKTRKWSRWNIPANCAEILIRPGNEKEMTFAGGFLNGTAKGNLYTLDSSKFTDDDYGQMFPYYTTYFFVNHEQEQMLGIGTDRKLVKKICGFVTGVGYVSIIPFVNSLQNPLPQTSPRLLMADSDPSNLANQDLEWTTGIRGQRIAFRIQVEPEPGATDVQMRIQKLIVHMMKDPVIIHRSSAI